MSTAKKKGYALALYITLAFAIGPYPIVKQAVKYQLSQFG
jgi:hypothetical protein